MEHPAERAEFSNAWIIISDFRMHHASKGSLMESASPASSCAVTKSSSQAGP
jgi:hypothetical protein